MTASIHSNSNAATSIKPASAAASSVPAPPPAPVSAPPAAPRQIRFVNNQGQPPSKRRRINAACLTCRRRKTRCAGERPLCSTCTKNGHQCLGYPEDIKREDGAGDKSDLRADYDEDLAQDNHREEVEEGPTKKLKRSSKSQSPVRRRLSPPLHTKPPGKPSQSQHDVPEPKTWTGDPTPTTPHPDRAGTVGPSDDFPGSPGLRRTLNHRVPYFRYFGPTAIVPGFKQMVVSVRDRRRSTGASHSDTSPMSVPSGHVASSSAAESDIVVDDLPAYNPSDAGPVHSLIMHLVKTFFSHLGCNYPFLHRDKFVRMVEYKKVEPILVDAICGLAARFSDSPLLTGGNTNMPRTERGVVFAQRAKQATVDTFACPSVGAVQACLLMAYEGFGASQDSALWMYLGLAIRMAMDLGLQKDIGIRYQGEKDPWYSRPWSRKNGDDNSPEEKKVEDPDGLSLAEQREVEQERIDTFWAVFVLDRVISSGTGRPVTFRDGDFELSFPEPTVDPATSMPRPFPVFLQIVYLYGQVCDVLNTIRNAKDLTQDKWDRLTKMETHLTKLYKSWDSRLQFNVVNFKAYIHIGQGTTFILLHFWFHALFIILHQPTLLTPFGELRSELQLLADSRELSMSSAKTICDILSFADLIDPKSFIGNPFTSQPIYIAACAFLMESSATASREGSPPPVHHGWARESLKLSRHSLLASAANQNYQRCYTSLQQVHHYWGGIKYILTALDQKAKGIWDCETYTSEEYESTKVSRRESVSGPFSRLDGQGMGSPRGTAPPIAWSLAGTANSPNSSLTLMYQNANPPAVPHAAQIQQTRRQTSTPPGNMVYDPIRQSIPDSSSMYPPAYPQPNTSAIRQSPRQGTHRRISSHLSPTSVPGRPPMKYEGTIPEEPETGKIYIPTGYTPSSQQSSGFDNYNGSPASNSLAAATSGMASGSGDSGSNMYYPPNMPYPTTASWGGAAGTDMGVMDSLTFDSQDIDIGALGLQQPELMGPWLDYIPNDMLGLFENQDMGQGEQ